MNNLFLIFNLIIIVLVNSACGTGSPHINKQLPTAIIEATGVNLIDTNKQESVNGNFSTKNLDGTNKDKYFAVKANNNATNAEMQTSTSQIILDTGTNITFNANINEKQEINGNIYASQNGVGVININNNIIFNSKCIMINIGFRDHISNQRASSH